MGRWMGAVMIFTDSYYNQDPSRASKEDLPIVNNKRECPCDNCPMMVDCDKYAKYCKAFRNWTNKGDYKDADVQRLMRGV